MSLPESRLAYDDCIKLMDRAIEDGVGARTKKPDHSQAAFFRLRAHKCRQIIRDDNRQMYRTDPTHPMYGRSVYDKLRFTLEPADPADGADAYWVYARIIDIDDADIESLSEVE